MSISGIPSTIFSPSQSTSVTNTIQPEFQQLGQSLQSGNFVGAIGVCQFAAGVFAVAFGQHCQFALWLEDGGVHGC